MKRLTSIALLCILRFQFPGNSMKTNIIALQTSKLFPKTSSYIQFMCSTDISNSIPQFSHDSNIPLELDLWTKVCPIPGKGLGLFSTTIIPTVTPLGIYKGEILSWREYNKRYPSGNSEYAFLLNPSAQRRHLIYVDAIDPTKSNRLRYINHDGKSPNVITKIVYTQLDHSGNLINASITRQNYGNYVNTLTCGKLSTATTSKTNNDFSISTSNTKKTPHVLFETARTIAAGEELCFDYGRQYLAPWNQS